MSTPFAVVPLPKDRALTDRQRRVLDFICRSIDEEGYPPTLREIGNELGIRSTNGVNDHLRALERKGYLTRTDMKSRTLRPTALTLALVGSKDEPPEPPLPAAALVPDDEDLISIDVIGRVAAGPLTTMYQDVVGTVRIDRMMLGKKAGSATGGTVFGLRVRGDSMIDAGIHDGDYVFVRKTIEAQKGDIVVAMVGDEATCKRYFPEPGGVRLQPENTSMEPILIARTDWRETQIIGVVVGVYRRIG